MNEGPEHPRLKATLLMVGVFVLIVVLSALSVR